jgi:hypothetical protein
MPSKLRPLVYVFLCSALAGATAAAQRPVANYDEDKVGAYTLPDPLVLQNGQPVRDTKAWNEQRRAEIVRLFEDNVYGRSPARPGKIVCEVFDRDEHALGGKAVRTQATVYLTGKRDGPKMDVLLYLPVGVSAPAPVFFGLNFQGNHAVAADPGIKLAEVWDRGGKGRTRAAESDRGSAAASWQVEKILAQGFGLATVYYGDIEPDFAGGIAHGIRPFFFKPGQTAPASNEWGALGAWAWGISRALDYLETEKGVDAKRVALIGHSRLGKTTLWAGAVDTRFAAVFAVQSGEGGASLSRRNYGQTVKDLSIAFPYWFCGNFAQYSDHVEQLPVDQHMLIALVAPRPVYVSSAEEDRWSDPRGEFLALVGAAPVYRLLGKDDLGTDQMPALHQPIMHTEGYHIRAGKHEVTAYDWDCFLQFADQQLKKVAR